MGRQTTGTGEHNVFPVAIERVFVDDRIETALSLSRRTFNATREAEVSFLAAAVAYFAFVSLIPLLLLAVAVATAVGGEAFAQRVVDQSGTFLTKSGQEVVFEALSTGTGRSGATVVGIFVLAWGALRLFRGLDKAFAHVYAAEESGTLLNEIRDAAVVLATVGLGVVAVVAISTLGTVSPGLSAEILGTVSLVGVLIATLLPLYYVLPNVDMRIREALPGTVMVAIGWTLLGELFGWYASTAANFALYGVLGGVLLLLTWLYLGAMLVIVGAIVNAVFSERRTLL